MACANDFYNPRRKPTTFHDLRLSPTTFTISRRKPTTFHDPNGRFTRQLAPRFGHPRAFMIHGYRQRPFTTSRRKPMACDDLTVQANDLYDFLRPPDANDLYDSWLTPTTPNTAGPTVDIFGKWLFASDIRALYDPRRKPTTFTTHGSRQRPLTTPRR
ncbi:hypothetical protein B0H17DRAFT_1199704 [Mycena rosella]|uniref:Uncharacterized protein n=1 Tax=Mycena rosella TaxID=1033263 RepID=A0AAD7DN82_MYCRO|nr:hypothetical protein B0H17DRAFT_1199704 [Mycena rosella]